MQNIFIYVMTVKGLTVPHAQNKIVTSHHIIICIQWKAYTFKSRIACCQFRKVLNQIQRYYGSQYTQVKIKENVSRLEDSVWLNECCKTYNKVCMHLYLPYTTMDRWMAFNSIQFTKGTFKVPIRIYAWTFQIQKAYMKTSLLVNNMYHISFYK